MWIVKISGSLNKDSMLPLWLELMAQLGGGRVTIVCGGGRFAQEARHAHRHWRFADNLQAHNMGVLAMGQAAYLAMGIEPKLRLAVNESEIRKILRAGHTAVWLPLELLRDLPDADTAGGVSSDRIALNLAIRVNAEQLILVKPDANGASGARGARPNAAELGATGIEHHDFEFMTRRVGFPIDIVHCGELARMRSLLHGDLKPIHAT